MSYFFKKILFIIVVSLTSLYSHAQFSSSTVVRTNDYFDDGGAPKSYYVNRIGDVLYGLVDSYTGEQVTYTKTTTETTIDGAIIRKKGSEYFKRNFSGSVSVKWFGVKGDGSTVDTTNLKKAIASIPAKGELYFPSGIYRVSNIQIRRSDISIRGAGSASTILKAPDGDNHCILELGNLADGNDAAEYKNLTVFGFTFDGNNSTSSSPTDDLHGWGVASTKISYSNFYDVKAINCHSGGFGFFINSNWNNGVFYAKNCGFTNVYAQEPAVDLNSSKYNNFSIIADSSAYGVRLLDNCFSNIIDAVVTNAKRTGVVVFNQLVNKSFGNTIRATIEGGCDDQAVVVGFKNFFNTFYLNINKVNYVGVIELDSTSSGNNASSTAHNNTYYINATETGAEAAKIGGYKGDWHINSHMAGRAGSVGDFYSVEVHGNYNNISAQLSDNSTKRVRGLVFRYGITRDNVVTSFITDSLLSEYQDNGVRNNFIGISLGDDLQSNNALDIPLRGSSFKVKGTTSIADIAYPEIHKGKTITLVFDDTLVIGASLHIKLPANITTYKNFALQLFCDGINFYPMNNIAWLKTPQSISVTGTTTKTVSLLLKDNSTISATFTDSIGTPNLSASSVIDFASTAAQLSSEQTVTVSGATVGMTAIVNSTINPANSSWSAYVSGANTVTIRFNNYSSVAIDPASATFNIRVIK